MRKLIFPSLFAVLLCISCAGLPPPEGPDDTLVVGSIVLDFPDGFFNNPPRTVESGIVLKVVNRTRQNTFMIQTVRGGFFSFLSNGSDEYVLDSFTSAVTEATGRSYKVGSKLGEEFTPQPRRVHYLGHLVFRYAEPKEKIGARNAEGSRLWHYEVDLKRTQDRAALEAYLKSAGQDSPWVDYEVGP